MDARAFAYRSDVKHLADPGDAPEPDRTDDGRDICPAPVLEGSRVGDALPITLLYGMIAVEPVKAGPRENVNDHPGSRGGDNQRDNRSSSFPRGDEHGHSEKSDQHKAVVQEDCPPQ